MVRLPVLASLLLSIALPSNATSAPLTKVIGVDGVRLTYVEQGSGEPIVLVHGAFSDLRVWEPIREEVAKRYRFIAYTQRYFGTEPWPDDGKNFTLCIDEAFKGFNKEGRGERLFDAQGKQTPYVDNVLKFLQQYQLEFRRTQQFCRKLRELNLLEPMRAQLALASGERVALSGFMAVERARLKTLGAERLAELARTDELELVYAHLQSIRNFGAVREKMGGAPSGGAAAAQAPRAEPEREKKPAKKR